MPILKYFGLQKTMIEDESFEDTFTNLNLPELVSFAIAQWKPHKGSQDVHCTQAKEYQVCLPPSGLYNPLCLR